MVNWLDILRERSAKVAAWVAEYSTEKRRRTWQRAWDRSGLTACVNAIALDDCMDAMDLPLVTPPEDSA